MVELNYLCFTKSTFVYKCIVKTKKSGLSWLHYAEMLQLLQNQIKDLPVAARTQAEVLSSAHSLPAPTVIALWQGTAPTPREVLREIP